MHVPLSSRRELRARRRSFALSRCVSRLYLPPMPPSAPAHSSAVPATAGQRPVAQAEGLVRTFGGRRAVDGVSFTLHAGDCLALFGPNGAGKTTLLRMLAGLLAPGEGAVRVNGVPVKEGAAARAQV